MSTPFETIPAVHGAALAIAGYIVHSLWQGMLMTALAALVVCIFRSANATTRYAVWYIALVAVVVAPAVTASVQAVSSHVTAEPAGLRSGASGPSGAVVSQRASSAAAVPAAATASVRSREGAAFAPAQRLAIALTPSLTLVIAALWIAGALIGLFRIALGYAALARLQRDALPVPPGYRDALPLWGASVRRGWRATRLCVSAQVAVPVAIGFFDGMVLMPDHLLHSFDRADVDRFSLHELAHLQRRDDWTCAFERIACALLFFNPFVHAIARRLDLEREVACDDWVVTQTREVRPYAVGLTKMAEATPWPHRPIPASAIFTTRKSLSIRIERLLNKRRDIRPKIAGGAAAACTVAILSAAFVLLPVAPIVGGTAIAATPSVSPTTPASPAKKPRTASRTARVDFLDSLNAVGFGNISTDEIIALHERGIGTPLLLAAGRYFKPHASVADVIALAMYGVSAARLDDFARNAVICSPQDMIVFVQNGVSARYIAAVRHAFPAYTNEHVLLLARNGVSQAFITGLRERGYDSSADDIIRLAAHAVSLQYVDAVNAHHGANVPLADITSLHDHGVDPDAR